MADVVEVVARLGDSIVSVAHGATVTVGESGDVFAPSPTVTFAVDSVTPHTTTAGLLTIDIRRVPAATDRVARKRFDPRAAAYIGISLFVHLALWGTSMHTSRGELGTSGATHYRHALALRTTPPTAPSDADSDVTDEGLFDPVPLHLPNNGIGPIDDIVGHASVDIVEDPARTFDDLETRRARAMDGARTSGILGADSLRGTRPLGSIPGTGSPASGFDGRAIHGAAHGEAVGTTFGTERHLGGGGCTQEPCGTIIGTGRYGTLCGGDKPGEACRYGTFGSGLGPNRPRVAAVPTIHLCGSPDPYATASPCVKLVGDLDKAIIRRYIRRKLGAFTACYEKQLLVDSKISGTVETEFTIDSIGRTRDITATGLDAEVASCVATVIETIRFPASKNGGLTKVHYPFTFIIAGG